MHIMNIIKLAKKLNLSITTVSRALGGYSDVSEATRKRVMDFAKKHNYNPNPYASNLASHKSNAVGFVIPLYGLNNNTLNQIAYFKFVAGMSSKINQDLICQVIDLTSPSVSASEINKYSASKSDIKRNKIGF